MDNKCFKKSEEAVIADLNRIEKFSSFAYGRFIGVLDVQKIWLELSEKQFNTLKKYIDNTFLRCFSIFNKRKKYINKNGKITSLV